MAALKCSTAIAACAFALGVASAANAQDVTDLRAGDNLRRQVQGPQPTVNFTDPATLLAQESEPTFGVDARREGPRRFANLGPGEDMADRANRDAYEVAFTASGPLDLSIAQRGRFGADDAGDISRQGRGSEVRVGQGLDIQRQQNSSEPTWYVFAASDDEAVTWNPGGRNEFGGSGARFAVQDRVEIGDIQAGVTYEQNGIQASIAYVERDVSTRVGVQSMSRAENFAGFTLTMKR